MISPNTSPESRNKREFPAEWQKQSGIILVWPHKDTDWITSLEQTEQVYIQLAQAIAPYQAVLIICKDSHHLSEIKQRLNRPDDNNIIFYVAPYNDTWVRDYGPISIMDNGLPALLNFQYNGWGNKFESKLDNNINNKLTRLGAWQPDLMNDIPFILEGGSIDCNGDGLLLTTSACLLNKNRNVTLDKQALEQLLCASLGVSRVLWLNHGHLIGDDTDSHIDTLARFCDADTIIYMACDNTQDEHYDSLKKMEQELQTFRTSDGKPFRLIPILIPPPIYDKDGNRLPASYVNFLFTNGPVLLPIYNDKEADQNAVKQIMHALPNKEIITIDCSALILQHGSLHCITMQLLHGIL